MGGQTDKFGIPFWYASKSGGFFYEMSDNPKNDDAIDNLDSDFSISNGVITMHPSGPTSFAVGKNAKGFSDSIGGCKQDQSKMAAQGYTYKKDDVRDLEYKCIMKINNIGSHGFSISACTGHHPSNSSPCCQGNCYMGNIDDSTRS